MRKKVRLNPSLLLSAYSQGYFPMPDSHSDDILWYRPDPRAILPLDAFHVSHSFRRRLNKQSFQISFDQDFQKIMECCALHPDTWINNEFIDAYCRLFELGYAHSVEVWCDDKLAGGTYGVGLAGAFFAESMFHFVTDASKVALYALTEHLRQQGFSLLEIQFLTPHLESLGAIEISDSDYIKRLTHALSLNPQFL